MPDPSEKKTGSPSEKMKVGRLYPPPARNPSSRFEPPTSSGPEDPEVQAEGDTRIEKEDAPQIPIVLNKQVEWFIRYFTGPNRATFAKWLERSGRYENMIRRILREEKVPEDLLYIALIESGFNERAYSWAGASGIWQFMRPTARKYGLVVNWWIDERRDPVKATRAAANYFRDLHETFRSWDLAQAGYNAGEGRIRRGLRRVKRKDFWTLAKTRYIARETRNFVPKFIAASIIARNPTAYGFDSLDYEKPLAFESVAVPRPTDLRWLASAAGISVSELRSLNPELRRWKTPPKYPDYKIKVPVGASAAVARAIANWTPAKLAGRKYRVRPGDSLGEIARQLGVSLEAMVETNGIRDPGRIFVGQELLVPGEAGEGEDDASSSGEEADSRNESGKPAYHVVRTGESLWKISRRFGVSIEDLLAWNRLSVDAPLYPGDKLLVAP